MKWQLRLRNTLKANDHLEGFDGLSSVSNISSIERLKSLAILKANGSGPLGCRLSQQLFPRGRLESSQEIAVS